MSQTNDLSIEIRRRYEPRKSRVVGLTFLVALFSITANAELSIELEAGVGLTDNISRATDEPGDEALDDTIYSAGIEILYEHESARSEVDVRGSLSYLEYMDGPYASETLPAFDASAIFRITDQSLSWFVVGTVGQQTIDPFQPTTPGNREDISYITTGPSIVIPIGTRFEVNSDLYFSDVNYDVQPLDNQRVGAQLAFVRRINPTRSFAMNFTGERSDFDREEVFPSLERYGAFLRFETEGSRNEVAIEMGWNTSERAGVESDSPLIGIEWRRRLSQSLDLFLSGGTRISDAADSFRDHQQGSVDYGNTQDHQSLSTPFREDYIDLTMTSSGERTVITAGIEWQDEDYEQGIQFDRETAGFMLSISRQISAAWELSVLGTFDKRDFSLLSRDDDDTRFGLTLTYSRTRLLDFELIVDHVERDSSETASDYTENRVYLGFRYRPELGR